MSETILTTFWKGLLYALILIIISGAGIWLAQQLVPQPKVGLINLEGQVTSITAEILTGEIEYVLQRGDIKAIVLVINSPGGSAAAGHDIYYQLRRLRDYMPLVASADTLAASAAYQAAVAANEIYAKPATLIGNVGVIFRSPSPETLSENILTTGPFKSTGGSETSYLQKLDLLYADFRDSVVAERREAPNPLTLSPTELATGEIWVGIEAKEYGIIDELGSRQDAIDAAAWLAGIRNYETITVRNAYIDYLREEGLLVQLELYEQLEAEQEAIDLTSEETQWPEFYQLYIPLE